MCFWFVGDELCVVECDCELFGQVVFVCCVDLVVEFYVGCYDDDVWRVCDQFVCVCDEDVVVFVWDDVQGWSLVCLFFLMFQC